MCTSDLAVGPLILRQRETGNTITKQILITDPIPTNNNEQKATYVHLSIFPPLSASNDIKIKLIN